MAPLLATWLGRIPYGPAWDIQRDLAARRAAGELPDVLLLLEHDPVYTLGRRATEAEVLLDPAELTARAIAVEHSDRGGLATYHGPGQLVGYPIVDLGPTGDLAGYVRGLERALVAAVGEFGIDAGVVPGLTGVWVGDAKLAAIGVHVSRGITTHGFALNVTTDLAAFNGIIPCGIVDRGVTSIEALTGRTPSVRRVAHAAARQLARVMGRALAYVDPSMFAIQEVTHRVS